jgi:LmbE family N-acetylglucosaminyl deacetylase
MSEPRPRILIVEDDALIAAVIMELAGELGEIQWVPSAEEALLRLNSGSWDLLVSDIELPGMSGLDLVGAVKRACPLMATLVLTAHGSFDYAVAAVRAHADDFLTKPIEASSFVLKLMELIAVARSRREAGSQNVLAIGAHPDDVEIGCGGTILRHIEAGDTVTLLTLTGGEQGGQAAERARESERAATLLGATLIHTDLEDTSVGEAGATITAIKRAIDRVQPQTIYTHTLSDVHQDHRNVHRATLVAAREVPSLYCYQAPSTTVEFRPTRFIAIDDFLNRKLEAIQAFNSQVTVRRYLLGAAAQALRGSLRGHRG